MTQATFSVSSQELSADIIDNINRLFRGSEFHVFIRVQNKETRQEARERIDRAIEEIENKQNLVFIAGEDFDSFTEKLKQQ